MIHRIYLSHKYYRRSLKALPFFFTFANALCGFLSVLESINENFLTAALLIGIAALMDLCDGRLARALGSSSCLGAELDALCDAISFCFAPVILLCNFFDYAVLSLPTLVLGFYLCTGLYRLAKFNVLGSSGTADPAYFSGLSTPVSAFFLASIIFYAPWFSASKASFLVQPLYNTVLVALLALLMMSTIPFPTFKKMKLTLVRGSSVAVMALVGCWAMYKGLPVIFFGLVLYIIASLMRALLKWATS